VRRFGCALLAVALAVGISQYPTETGWIATDTASFLSSFFRAMVEFLAAATDQNANGPTP
jgi:hypothetical protein